jgi:ribosomal protein S18 acetylase RimI-like enzyme
MNRSMTEQGTKGGVTIKAVVGRENRSDFLDVPCLIHADDPVWIAPLRMIEAERFDPKKHPFYEHGEVGFWVAYKDGKPVGRICAQVDRLHLERYGDAMGHFGMLEAIDDPAVFAALFATAEAWLREHGIERVTGPFNLSINEESGMLADGFESPPAVMTDHAKPYYGPRIEELGYRKAKDLYAFDFDFSGEVPERMFKLAGALERYPQVKLRRTNMRKLHEEFRSAIDVYNDAWSKNWNFVPFTQSETDALIKTVKPFVSPHYMWFAEDNGRPIGFVAALPDLNQAARGLNGRLLPFGWIKLLWRVKFTGVKRARLLLLGVRKAYQSTALAAIITAALMLQIREAGLELGMEGADISWVLEDNSRLLKIVEHGGLKRYKTFRVYERELGEPPPTVA